MYFKRIYDLREDNDVTQKAIAAYLEIQPNVIGMRKKQYEGYWVPLEVCARIYNNTFYVPLEAVIREFGLSAEINGDEVVIK